MKILQKICFVLLLGTFSSVYGGDCFDGNNFDINICQKQSEQGDADAQFNLGWMYFHGLGVPKDYKEAVKWYTKSAKQGYAPAQNNLANMYDKGQGVPRNGSIANDWWSKSGGQREARREEQGEDELGFVMKLIMIGTIVLIVYTILNFIKETLQGFFSIFVPKKKDKKERQERQDKSSREKKRQEKEREEKNRREKERQEREQQEERRHREKEGQKKEREEKSRREKERQEREQQEQYQSRKKEKPKNSNEKKRSYEEILGLSSGWTKSDLKSAYRKKCQQIHPDKWKDFPDDIAQRLEEEYKEVQKAYKYLSKK